MSSAEQVNQEEIEQQHTLLAVHRRNLAHLTQQAAQHGGEVYAPPSVSNGIYEARTNIRRIKTLLRARGVPITDHPDDEPPVKWPIGTQTSGRSDTTVVGGNAEGNVDNRAGTFISGGTIYGPVVGTNIGAITTTYSGTPSDSLQSGVLEQVVSLVEQVAAQARQRGAEEMVEDLSRVLLALQAALKAQRDGKTDRRIVKLREAETALQQLETSQQLHEVMYLLRGIVS